MNIEQLTGDIEQLLMPFISALLIIVITFWFKDLGLKIAKGLAFRMNRTFREGDHVFLDDEEAIIVSIGLTQSVFGIKRKGINNREVYIWRYVPNDRIPFLKLEKMIFNNINTEEKTK